MVFYFTATGNSLYAARLLEDGKPISVAQAIHGPEKRFQSERIGVVCPVFGHEMPPLVKEFIAQSEFETDYLYVILTYGNRHGGAAELAEEYFRQRGLSPAYVNVVLMADNFLPAFDMEKQKRTDKKVEEQLETIRRDIHEKKRMISPVTEKDRAAHQEYLKRAANAPAFQYRISDKCVGCAVCVRVCPKGCFSVRNQRAVWDASRCMLCMACIHACSQKAIGMNLPEKNPEARYRNPHVSLTDIVQANNQTARQRTDSVAD